MVTKVKERKDLNESEAAMPQIVKQTGWAKPNQLPAGPRKKRRLCRRLFSRNIICWCKLDCRYAVCIYTLCRAGTGSGVGQCNHFAAMLGWWSGGAIHQMWTPAHCDPLCALQLSPHHCRWSIHMFYGHKAGGGVCKHQTKSKL